MNKLIAFFAIIFAVSNGLPATINKALYPNTISLDSTLTMYYLVDTVNSEIEVALECQCTGVVGWGLSRGTGMLNSDVYIGWVANDVPAANDYSIGSSRSFSCPDGVCADSVNNLLQFNGSEANGVTQMLFRRKLDTGDSKDVAIVSGSSNTLIYIWTTSSDGPTINKHTRTPQPKSINFFTGGVVTIVNKKQIAHGSMMFIAWYALSTAGFILARFMKGFSWWFNAHRIIMFIAMLTSLAAFILIVVEASVHFDTAHKIIGLIVVIIGTAQPIIGFLADKLFNPDRKSTPIFPDKVHWVLGWVSITLGFINIILGLIQYGNASNGLIVAYCVIAAITFVSIVGFAIFRLIKPSKGGHGGGGDH